MTHSKLSSRGERDLVFCGHRDGIEQMQNARSLDFARDDNVGVRLYPVFFDLAQDKCKG